MVFLKSSAVHDDSFLEAVCLHDDTRAVPLICNPLSVALDPLRAAVGSRVVTLVVMVPRLHNVVLMVVAAATLTDRLRAAGTIEVPQGRRSVAVRAATLTVVVRLGHVGMVPWSLSVVVVVVIVVAAMLALRLGQPGIVGATRPSSDERSRRRNAFRRRVVPPRGSVGALVGKVGIAALANPAPLALAPADRVFVFDGQGGVRLKSVLGLVAGAVGEWLSFVWVVLVEVGQLAEFDVERAILLAGQRLVGGGDAQGRDLSVESGAQRLDLERTQWVIEPVALVVRVEGKGVGGNEPT
ncbi:hypothetical protein IWZ01DRAFT_574680 [Phyllosticta capitalensis]